MNNTAHIAKNVEELSAEEYFLLQLTGVSPALSIQNVPQEQAVQALAEEEQHLQDESEIEEDIQDLQSNHELLNYEDLLYYSMQGPAGSPSNRALKTTLGSWLEYKGLGWADVVDHGLDMIAVNGYCEWLETFKKLSAKTIRNRRYELKLFISKASLWHAEQALDSDEADPKSDFHSLIKKAMAYKKVDLDELRDNVSPTCVKWATGATYPDRKTSIGTIHKLEEYLSLPKDSLVFKTHLINETAFSLAPKSFAWGKYLSVVRKSTYELPEGINKDIDTFLMLYAAHKKKSSLRGDDSERYYPEPKEMWNVQDSLKSKQSALRGYFGYLCLPVHPALDWEDLVWEEQLRHGRHGFKPEEINPLMLFDKDMLLDYIEYKRARSFDKESFAAWEESPLSPMELGRKTVSQSEIKFIVTVNNMVNKPYSFLRVNRGWLKGLELVQDEEGAWLKEAHNKILDVARKINRLAKKIKRNPSDKLDEILDLENPLGAVWAMIDEMKRLLPPKTAPVQRDIYLRDIAMFSFLCWEPLRRKNVASMEMDKNLYQRDGVWRFKISTSELKNAIHGKCRDKDMEVPEFVLENLLPWLEARKKYAAASASDKIFIKVDAKGFYWPTREALTLSPQTVSRIWTSRTEQFLGRELGPHSIRHIVGSTIARMGGGPAHIAAVLNDSEDVAMRIYNRINKASFDVENTRMLQNSRRR